MLIRFSSSNGICECSHTDFHACRCVLDSPAGAVLLSFGVGVSYYNSMKFQLFRKYQGRSLINMASLVYQALIASLVLMLTACATAPTQEMSDARQAVRAAQEAGAELHAPDVLSNAEQQLDRAGERLHEHNYRQARKKAVAAREQAFDAQEIALAIGAAVNSVEKARQKGVLSAEADVLLKRAKEAASHGDVQVAVRLANEARNIADQDLRIAD